MIAPKPNKDDVRIHVCVDMIRVNEAIQWEKLLIPTVDEVLEKMNGTTVFSEFNMNMGFVKLSLTRGQGISQHFQTVIHCIVTRG